MNAATALPRRLFGETMRADGWWTQPLLVFIGLSICIIYSTWAVFHMRLELAFVQSFSRRTSFYSMVTLFVATHCGIWPAAFSINFQDHQHVIAPTLASRVSIAATCSGRGVVCSGSVAPISTCACAQWESGTISE